MQHPDLWEMSTLERRYSVPPSALGDPLGRTNPVEDLHAWSIYRQNLNSGFTDSALGSSEKSSPPYGNFRLRESTVHSIISHPKYGPTRRSAHELAGNMYSYLKFGLPRVFPPSLAPASAPAAMNASATTMVLPPRGPRETSSGYDSSDDGFGAPDGSPSSLQRNGPFRRSKSEPDFRSQYGRRKKTSLTNQHHHHHHQGGQGAHFHQHQQVNGGVGGGYESEMSTHTTSSYWRDQRQKSNSEANLLRSGHQHLYHQHYHGAGGGGGHHHAADKRSRAGSQMSVLSQTLSSKTHIGGFHAIALNRTTASRADLGNFQLLNERFFPKDNNYFATLLGDGESSSSVKHPHLQVRELRYEIPRPRSVPAAPSTSCCWDSGPGRKNRFRILDGIRFEVHGGEMMAVMATSEEEGTALLDALANRCHKRGVKVLTDLVVNGLQVSPDKLVDRIAYVQQDCTYTHDMSVRQTLLFTSLLKEPGNPSRGFDTKGRVNAIIEDLGLGLVKHTRVKHLTLSEKRRLNVACHLLLDTDIVLLDQPTRGMDVFDSFFLVEYLRQWAARGRIVIISIHPQTYEIFTMMSKIALISCGRLMYFGKRREMLPYFAFIEFPCPAYKNPSDYYLDLVTLDNLSAEAMLESSERIKLLADTFHRRQETLSDPGPPGIPPPKVKRSNLLVQILALWIRAMIYMFPYNLINLAQNIFIVALLSVIIGAIYQGVRFRLGQEDIQDRFGFHYVMMGVAVWPLVMLTVSEVWTYKDAVARDLTDELYSKTAYILSKMAYSFLTSSGVFLAYIIPAYAMSGLKPEDDNQTFSVYLGYMLLYLFSIRTMAMALAYTFDSRHVAVGVAGFVFTLVVTCAGYTVHFLDLSIIFFWFQWVSPMRWMMEQLVVWDLIGGDADRIPFTCIKNPIVAQNSTILVKAPCGFPNGHQTVHFLNYSQWSLYYPIPITLAFWAFWQIWIFIFFGGKKQHQKKSKRRIYKDML